VEKSLIDATKRYAEMHDTTVSQLISDFLRALIQETAPPSATPVLDKLAGVLPPDTTTSDYWQHLNEKYGV